MKRRAILIAALGMVLLGAWLALGRPGLAPTAEKRKPQVLVVETTTVLVKPMPIRLEAVGQVESQHVVQIRPQVTGVLKHVAFAEGDEVSAGQLLFEIDPAPFRAAVAQAQAALARDRAALAKARWQADRLEPLAKLDYVTPQEYEDAKAAVTQARAAVAADKAAIQQAEIELGYTAIRAPITGRTGSIAFKEGNLVQANGATPLVTINELSPIRVRFGIAQGLLDEIRRYQAQGSIRVMVQPGGTGDGAPSDGRLVFVDNSIDPITGTVTLKAQFDNAKRLLWPGQYVTVEMVLAVQPNAVVVPDSAVQPGQNGSYVYLVDDGHVKVRSVRVVRQLDGLSVISEGLQGGETVVAKVPRNLRDGAAVKPIGAGDRNSAGDKPRTENKGQERNASRR